MKVYPASEAPVVSERALGGGAVTPHPSPAVVIEGDSDLRAVRPDGTDLWVVRGTLAPGTTLRWTAEHEEQAVYVLAGSLAVTGGAADGEVMAAADGALVVEAGAVVEAVAAAGTEIVHFGGGTSDRPTSGRAVVVGAGGTHARIDDEQNVRFFADATSPSCGLWLLYSQRHQPHQSPTHSHAQDELIHLLGGELVMGSWRVRPGDTLFVEADRRYRFRSGDDGYAFLNYREGPSVMITTPDASPIVENGEATGMTEIGDVVVVG